MRCSWKVTSVCSFPVYHFPVFLHFSRTHNAVFESRILEVTVLRNPEPLATRLVLKFRNGFDILGVINSKLKIFSVALSRSNRFDSGGKRSPSLDGEEYTTIVRKACFHITYPMNPDTEIQFWGNKVQFYSRARDFLNPLIKEFKRNSTHILIPSRFHLPPPKARLLAGLLFSQSWEKAAAKYIKYCAKYFTCFNLRIYITTSSHWLRNFPGVCVGIN